MFKNSKIEKRCLFWSELFVWVNSIYSPIWSHNLVTQFITIPFCHIFWVCHLDKFPLLVYCKLDMLVLGKLVQDHRTVYLVYKLVYCILVLYKVLDHRPVYLVYKPVWCILVLCKEQVYRPVYCKLVRYMVQDYRPVYCKLVRYMVQDYRPVY